jgi:CheY-like chemotaxis protein
MNRSVKLLWADDEIDLLKPHVIFLETKGYEVVTANNGNSAIEEVGKQNFDLIFLDENMPGLSGLQTLDELKRINPHIPVVMITKSEEENIMDQAIGSKIADYLIKPVNPNQILLAIKKNVDQKRLISETTTSKYQSEFMKLGSRLNESLGYKEWVDVYKQLVFWELEFSRTGENTMDEVLKMQKSEANSSFSKYIKNSYLEWLGKDLSHRPMFSPDILRHRVFPHLAENKKVIFLLIDNLRFDQWKVLEPLLNENYNIDSEETYYSILPTATQYSRNAIFAGLMPSEINKLFPDIWLNDEEEGGKNQHEEELLTKQMTRLGKNFKFNFEKITNAKAGKKLTENIPNLIQNPFTVVIYNFVDMLSHARTDSEMIRELASDEAAYRSLTLSWFEHSYLREFLDEVSKRKDVKLIISTDHGTIKVNNPIKVVGDRNTTTNLRYKQGRNLNYNPREVFEVTKPEKAFLPKTNISSTYIFTMNDDFCAYPNNYNHYVNYYKGTFQHGGISMEEIIIPLITLSTKQ